MTLGVPDSVLGRRRGSLTPFLTLGTALPVVSIKCVIVGDPETGKTCFLNSYVNPEQDVEKEYIPTVFDTYSITKELQDKAKIALNLYDTSSNVKNQIIRLDTYSQTDVFILAFAIDNVESFDNVKRWHREIRDFYKHISSMGSNNNVPILLVGMKSDTRKDRQIQPKNIEDAPKIIIDPMTSPTTYRKNLAVLDDPKMTPTTFRKRVLSAAKSKPAIYKKKNYTIKESQGMALAEELDISYFECSSCDKSGIENVFEEVIKLGLSAYQNE